MRMFLYDCLLHVPLSLRCYLCISNYCQAFNQRPIPSCSSCLRLVLFLQLRLKNMSKNTHWSYYWYTILLWHPCFKILVIELHASVLSIPILTFSHWLNCSFHWLVLELHSPKGKTFPLLTQLTVVPNQCSILSNKSNWTPQIRGICICFRPDIDDICGGKCISFLLLL